ncbi:uncharacterized protein LOC123904933 [Trifolium pratense]|uniref:uncharacterized protein LOC123904933 n=1 Tax=Trifolium pratense TaxID=57577 RepID=UPI001E692678|nr:uncharacterized protein LOC123904933 [Trifolium pratense]
MSKHDRSFVQDLQNSCEVLVSQMPVLAIRGETLSIQITQSEYERVVEDCKRNLHGGLVLNKGDKSVTARDLKAKLSMVWKTRNLWHMVSLGRGFYEFQFTSYEDMRLAWSMGSMNLKLEILRLSKWTNDFNPVIGTPLLLDESTKTRAFGHYACILVDIDLSRRRFDEIVVEREGYAFKLGVVYECLPTFCPHYTTIGHDLTSCRWIHPTKETAKAEVMQPMVPKKPQPQYVVKNKHDASGDLENPVVVDTLQLAQEQAKLQLEQHTPVPEQSVEDNIDNIITVEGNADRVIKSSTSFTWNWKTLEMKLLMENTREEYQTQAYRANSDNEEEFTILVELVQEGVPETQLELEVTSQSTASKSTETIPGTSVDNVFRDTQGRALPLVTQMDMQVIRQAWADTTK